MLCDTDYGQRRWAEWDANRFYLVKLVFDCVMRSWGLRGDKLLIYSIQIVNCSSLGDICSETKVRIRRTWNTRDNDLWRTFANESKISTKNSSRENQSTSCQVDIFISKTFAKKIPCILTVSELKNLHKGSDDGRTSLKKHTKCSCWRFEWNIFFDVVNKPSTRLSTLQVDW